LQEKARNPKEKFGRKWFCWEFMAILSAINSKKEGKSIKDLPIDSSLNNSNLIRKTCKGQNNT
jgi:hypothetical protein